jgi:hypothetical protein
MSQVATFDLGFAAPTAAAPLPRIVKLPTTRLVSTSIVRSQLPVLRTRTRARVTADASWNGIRIANVLMSCGWSSMLLASITLAIGFATRVPQLVELGFALGGTGPILLVSSLIARNGNLQAR